MPFLDAMVMHFSLGNAPNYASHPEPFATFSVQRRRQGQQTKPQIPTPTTLFFSLQKSPYT